MLAEALGWMAEAIPEFGLATMDVRGIIEWMKADLGSANAPGANCGCSWVMGAGNALPADQGWGRRARSPALRAMAC